MCIYRGADLQINSLVKKCRLTMLPPNRCERPILVIVPPLAPSSSVSSVLVGFWRQERTYWPIFFL